MKKILLLFAFFVGLSSCETADEEPTLEQLVGEFEMTAELGEHLATFSVAFHHTRIAIIEFIHQCLHLFHVIQFLARESCNILVFNTFAFKRKSLELLVLEWISVGIVHTVAIIHSGIVQDAFEMFVVQDWVYVRN